MKNQYMFFAQQSFENFVLSDYSKSETTIPKTSIYIYSFKCIESDNWPDDKSKAKKLDELTQRLTDAYPDMFQLINSGSSQFFCKEIYPHIVAFETKLRYIVYVAGSLFQNNSGNHLINKQTFLYKVDNKDKSIEDLDFGQIYECFFTDKDFQAKVKNLNNKRMSKDDWKKKIDELEERTIWYNIVGTQYDFVVKHFLEIIEYRNHVMHNHLISFAQYEKATDTLIKANQELDRVITDILIVNKSQYLNNVNIIDAISVFLKALGLAAQVAKESPLVKAIQLFAEHLRENTDTEQGNLSVDPNPEEEHDEKLDDQ